MRASVSSAFRMVHRMCHLPPLPLLFVLAGLVYVGLRLAAFVPSSTRMFPDSGTYLHVAAQPLLSSEFLAGWRGWTVPLLYKLLPDSDAARTVTQLAISIACWLALAAVVARCVRWPALRPAAFCLVLLFSLSVWVTQWDRLILSESVAVSLAAAVLAAWLAVARTPAPGGWAIAAVLASTLLWTFTRDSNAYVALLAVPFAIGWAALRIPRRPRIVLASGLIAIFIAHALALNSPTAQPRWENPLLNVIGTRVLTSETELEYFRAHGMPVPDRLQVLAGEELGGAEVRPLIEEDPRLGAFREWVRAEGRSTRAAFLLTHPDRALAPVVRNREALFTVDPSRSEAGGYGPISSYRATGTEPLLPGPIAAAVYPPSIAAVLAWLAAVIAAAAWLAWRGAARAVWLVPAIALLLQVPHAALVWHGGPLEVPRHALQVGAMTRLSLLLLSIFLIDAALSLRRRGVAPSPDEATPTATV
ncbi:MAG: hypothetical protein ACRDL1_00290 [Solirubrobacterales bacterium]